MRRVLGSCLVSLLATASTGLATASTGLAMASTGLAAPPTPLDLVDELEASASVVVGSFEQVSPLAHSAHLGVLRVEQVVAGDEPERPLVEVVWEEPGLTVPARFAPGHRALVGLAPLPTASIWKTRLPDGEQRARVVAIGGNGRASLARPSGAEIDLLAHYLALAPDAKAGDAGLTRLAQLAALAEPGLARAALARLARAHAAATRPLPREAAEAIVRVARRHDAPALTADLVAWLERTRPEELASPLRAAVAAEEPSAPVALRAALAAVEGELEPELATDLFRSQSESERMLACRYARGDLARKRLPGLVLSDPSPKVRAVAVERWVEVGGMAALPEALRAFEDPASTVQHAALQAVAGLGEPALPELVSLAESGRPASARMAVGALSMMGEPARPALVELAAGHEDEAVRALARMALGLPIGHEHE